MVDSEEQTRHHACGQHLNNCQHLANLSTQLANITLSNHISATEDGKERHAETEHVPTVAMYSTHPGPSLHTVIIITERILRCKYDLVSICFRVLSVHKTWQCFEILM